MGYILGIDVGVASLGTTVIRDSQPPKLYVRIFRSATGFTIASMVKGQDKAEKARNAERRQKRLQRRQIARRRRRSETLFHQLQRAGLLPDKPSRTARERDSIIKELDVKLLEKFLPKGNLLPELIALNIHNRNIPYILRALSLHRELEPFELGRALYHLGQRRGFKSNKKVSLKEFDGVDQDTDEESKKVGDGISRLKEILQGRTLGEFFAATDTDRTGQRVRIKPKLTNSGSVESYPFYTSRKMYEDEFNRIWKAQLELSGQKRHPVLNLPFRRTVYHTLFYQRPLKSQKGKIGRCELEPNRRRASTASLEFQRYRYWQKINDLIVYLPSGERPLSQEEKRTLATELDKGENASWTDIAALFGWKKAKGQKYLFNLQRQKEDKMLVNVTAKEIRKVYPGWDTLTETQQSQLVEILASNLQEKKKIKRMIEALGMSVATASDLSAVTLPSDYASYSIQALKQLLSKLQEGLQLYDALEKCYPERNNPRQVCDFLPPVKEVLTDINNPSVLKLLSELRKVVNKIIQQEGEKPELIRVELARVLKVGRKKRKEKHEAMIENRKAREKTRKKVAEICKCSEADVTDDMITKQRLWEECGGPDPYSGDWISPKDLFGEHPKFQIEHIYPKSISYDSSFANLTLCRIDYNLTKNKRTPKQAFGNNAEQWHEIETRVKSFKGHFAAEKLERFRQETVPQEFINRQLNDTSYMATSAVKYLATLYGGVVEPGINKDGTGKRRIETVPGQATARLRRLWGLNGILGPNALKNPDLLDELKLYENKESEKPTVWKKYRADHRHHAIDAFVIANCSAASIQRWARESELADEARWKNEERHKIDVPAPYGDGTFHTVKEAVDNIVVSYRCDHRLSGALHEETLRSQSAKEDGEEYKIKIPANDRTVIQRLFSGGDNHHIEVFLKHNKKWEEKWDVKTISLFEANRRKRFNELVIPTDNPKFCFALHNGDYVEIKRKLSDKTGELFRVVGLDGVGTIKIQHHTDARPWDGKSTKEYQEKYGVPIRPSLSSLQGRLVPVSVDVLGNVR